MDINDIRTYMNIGGPVITVKPSGMFDTQPVSDYESRKGDKMAYRLAEVWMNEDGNIVAIKRVGGGYTYWLPAVSTVNGVSLEDLPNVAREITSMNLEIMEAKKNG